MPAYNAEKWIEQAINSIISQTYSNWELLVADDGSSDGTRAIIDAYTDQRIIALHNTTNVGYLATCNALFLQCKGAYITFQDADDYAEPHRLERQLNAFKANAQLGVCGCFSRYFSERTRRTIRIRTGPVDHAGITAVSTTQTPFDGASMMVSAGALQHVGGYRTFFDRIGSEHVDWMLRIMEHFEACAVPEVLYHVRIADGSFSRTLVSPMQVVSGKIAHFLQAQRAANLGDDGLTPGADLLNEDLHRFIASELRAFDRDPSLIWRKSAANKVYVTLYREAAADAWRAIRTAPFKAINYRSLLHCLRKLIVDRAPKGSA